MTVLNIIIMLAGGKWRAAVLAALLAAVLTLGAANWWRGIELERLTAQAALIEQAATLRQAEFKRATQRLAEVRSTDNRARDSIIRGLKNEGDSILPSVLVDALDGLCDAGAPCTDSQ